MRHDQESHLRLIGQEALGPLSLPGGRACQFRFVDGMVTQYRAQEVYQAQPEIGMEELVDGSRRRMLNHSMNQSGLPARLGQAVAMNCHYSTVPDLKGCPQRIEVDTEVALPEATVPPVMVPTHHHDRQPAPKPGQGGGYVETAPGNHSGVGEPEIEQVTVDEQAIAHTGDEFEELEQRVLDAGRRHAEVGIGENDKGVAQHGAKDTPRNVTATLP